MAGGIFIIPDYFNRLKFDLINNKTIFHRFYCFFLCQESASALLLSSIVLIP